MLKHKSIVEQNIFCINSYDRTQLRATSGILQEQEILREFKAALNIFIRKNKCMARVVEIETHRKCIDHVFETVTYMNLRSSTEPLFGWIRNVQWHVIQFNFDFKNILPLSYSMNLQLLLWSSRVMCFHREVIRLHEYQAKHHLQRGRTLSKQPLGKYRNH